MNFIIELVELIGTGFDVLFAVPILGVLVLARIFGPMLAKAIKHR